MIITTPVTDYIPASVLTTNGDLVSRISGVVARFPPSTKGMVPCSQGAGVDLARLNMAADANLHLRGAGSAFYPLWNKLHLNHTGIHIDAATRDSAGDQVISDVGFQSSAIILLAIDLIGANLNWSIGFDNGTVRAEIYQLTNGTTISYDTSKCIWIKRDDSNYLMGVISAIGSAGFTITWTLNGACSIRFIYLCLP